MRFIIANDSFNIGGFSSFSLNLAKQLAGGGHEVISIVAEPIGTLEDEFVQAFDKVHVLKRGVESRKMYLKRVVSLVNEISPDVLINNGLPFVQAAFLYIPRAVVRISVTHSIQETEVCTATALSDVLDGVVCVSKNAFQCVEKKEPSCPVTLIPIGIEIPPTKLQNRPLERHINLIYVGRLSQEAKNISLLADIGAILHQRDISFKLTIVGDGEMAPHLKMRVTSLGYSDRVIFRGSITPAEVRIALRRAQIILLTSEYEGTPHSLLEAMSEGCVPVVSRIEGSTTELIQDGKNGILCGINDLGQFADGIEHLYLNPNQRVKMGVAAKNTVSERYSISQMTKAILNIVLNSNKKTEQFLMPSRQTVQFPSELLPVTMSLSRHLRRRVGDVLRLIHFR